MRTMTHSYRVESLTPGCDFSLKHTEKSTKSDGIVFFYKSLAKLIYFSKQLDDTRTVTIVFTVLHIVSYLDSNKYHHTAVEGVGIVFILSLLPDPLYTTSK